MCGFVVTLGGPNPDTLNQIKHRGPDSSGHFEDSMVYMGFNRLATVNTVVGNQPMHINEYVIVFNGEIYNYKELAEEFSCSSATDTEVILHGYIKLGKEIVNRLRGMFAFVIYNKETKEVFGARDMFGIKPLYYKHCFNKIYMASEYKAIPGARPVDELGLQTYLTLQYPLPPHTMVSGINQVKPGHYFTWSAKSGFHEDCYFKPQLYPFGNSAKPDPQRSVTTEDVRKVIEESVEKHLDANVPVGCFLSGGVDSTIVTSVANKLHPGIKTFSVGFDVPGYSELQVAEKTAELLKTDHKSLIITEDMFIDAIEDVVRHMDDPVADPSAVGLYLLSKMAAKDVTVALSGEGADEFFGGYRIYNEYYSLKNVSNLPQPFKVRLNQISKALPNGMKGKSFLHRATTPLNQRYVGNAKIFTDSEVKELYKYYDKRFNINQLLNPLFKEDLTYIQQMQNVDINTWMVGDILQKGDKMSMANSLEVRTPFLDKEVFNVAKNLTDEQKINKGTTKYLLREAFSDILPEHVVNRPKLGFPTPIRVWLQGDLGDYVTEVIVKSDIDTLLNKKCIFDMLVEHKDGIKDNSRKIWSIFILCLYMGRL